MDLRLNKALLPALALVLMAAPIVLAITIDGTYNFQGPQGGNVTFAQTFTASTIDYSTGLTTFHGLRWGGNARGTLGFDCDAGVNVTVTGITQQEITYTVGTAAPGNVVSYVYYLQTGSGGVVAPQSVTADGAAATYVYDAALGWVNVTTTGNPVVVVVSYASSEQTSLYRQLLGYLSLAVMIPMIVAVAYVWNVYQTGNFDSRVAGVIAGLVIAMVIIAYMLAQYL